MAGRPIAVFLVYKKPGAVFSLNRFRPRKHEHSALNIGGGDEMRKIRRRIR
jgi:hypothetical protein